MTTSDESISEKCARLLRVIETDEISLAIVPDLRVLRNSCGVSEENVEYIVASGLANSLFLYCKQLIRDKKLSLVDDTHRIFDICNYAVIVTVICQLIANISANRGLFAAYIWACGTESEGFEDLIEISIMVNRRDAQGAAIAAMFNCLAGSNIDCHERLVEFVNNRALVSRVLLSVPLKYRSSAVAVAEDNNKQDSVLEWLHLLVLIVVRKGLLVPMFLSIAPRSADEPLWTTPREAATRVNNNRSIKSLSTELTHEQVVLLNFIQQIFDDTTLIKEFSQLSDIDPNLPVKLNALAGVQDICVYLSECIMSWLNEFVDTCPVQGSSTTNNIINGIVNDNESFSSDSVIQRETQSEPRIEEEGSNFMSETQEKITIDDPALLLMNACRKKSDSDWCNLSSEHPIGLCFAVISSALSFLCSSDNMLSLRETQMSLVDIGLISACVCCIPTKIAPIDPIVGTASVGELRKSEIDSATSSFNEDRYEVTRESLSCLANVLFYCTEAQNELRLIGGIPVVLVNCSTDFKNPLSREWALLSIRNACAGNEANQQYIESLKVQKVAYKSNAIDESGISVELNQSGQINVTNPPSSISSVYQQIRSAVDLDDEIKSLALDDDLNDTALDSEDSAGSIDLTTDS